MTLRALQSAASGMQSHMLNLDTIANNLANAGTTAFKKSRTNFEDLYYEQIKLPGTQSGAQITPTGIAVGLGSRVAATEVDHRQGNLEQTEDELHVAIVGEGFFRVQDEGGVAFTRAGTFSKDAAGNLVITSANRGRLLDPPIQIPEDATSITITSDGTISVKQAGSTQTVPVGNIELTRFVNPKGLLQLGENLYSASDASGAPISGTPGTDSLGLLNQGFLEASNVEPVHELVGLIKTQRAVELNSQVVQASDQLLQLVANMLRF